MLCLFLICCSFSVLVVVAAAAGGNGGDGNVLLLSPLLPQPGLVQLLVLMRALLVPLAGIADAAIAGDLTHFLWQWLLSGCSFG